jgi:hypothetical protein
MEGIKAVLDGANVTDAEKELLIKLQDRLATGNLPTLDEVATSGGHGSSLGKTCCSPHFPVGGKESNTSDRSSVHLLVLEIRCDDVVLQAQRQCRTAVRRSSAAVSSKRRPCSDAAFPAALNLSANLRSSCQSVTVAVEV